MWHRLSEEEITMMIHQLRIYEIFEPNKAQTRMAFS
jgi:hypothetical protein